MMETESKSVSDQISNSSGSGFEKDLLQGQVEVRAREEKLAEEELLRQSLQEKEKVVHDYWDKMLRAKAELENFRKRSEKAAAEAIAYGQASVLERLLPIWDQWVAGVNQLNSVSSLDQNIQKGFLLVIKNMEEFFKAHGVIAIKAVVGEAYDPHLHEVTRLEESKDSDGLIVAVEQEGFLMGERVLRPAKVVVSKRK